MIRKSVGALVAVIASLSVVSPAMAVQHHPTGIFTSFADCPLSNPAVTLCIVIKFTGGEFVLGRSTVPIDTQIEVQGGLIPDEPESREFRLAAAEDGNTLAKVPLRVPGGLLGIGVAGSTTEVTATPELVGPTSAVEVSEPNLNSEEGIGLRLPIRAKLGSVILPNNCYLGSVSSPILLSLTTGTTSPLAPNRPIKGAAGVPSNAEQESHYALTISRVLLVDNAFGVPVVTGCGGFYAALVDSDLGLPSLAGRNTTVLAGRVELATAEHVRESE